MPEFGSSVLKRLNIRIERALQYGFRQKAEERPRHADRIAESTDKPAVPILRVDSRADPWGNIGKQYRLSGLCPAQHRTTGYAGPPHAPLPRRRVCLDCKEYASEDEIRERGYDFDNVPDWVVWRILDSHLEERQKHPSGRFLFLPGGRTAGIKKTAK